MNIVVIVVDTLRYDTLGANGNPNVKTPNLDRLAARSWNFHRMFAGSYPTIPNRTDLITGRYGGPFHPWKPLDCDKPTLPRALAELGYCTQLIHDTPHLVNGGHSFDYPFHAWTPVRGAEVDRAWLNDTWPHMTNWRFEPLFDPFPTDDETVLRKVNLMGGYVHTNRGREHETDWNVAQLFATGADFLRDNAKRDRFLLWLDCFDPHEPWDSPPEFVTMYDKRPGYDGFLDPRSFDGRIKNHPDLSPEAIAHIAAQYAAKVSFVDKWLGVFLDALEETGLAQRTAIVLTADHGTNVNDRDGHRFGKTAPPRDNEARIPLMVRVPGGGSGESHAIAQPQDVFATVMAIAGGTAPEGLESHDVLAVAREEAEPRRALALCGTAVNAWKRWGTDGVLFSAFDGEWSLGVAADPECCQLNRIGERGDVAAEHPDVVARLWREAVGEIVRRGLDPALADWLKSEGQGDFPASFRPTDAHPAPPGWRSYFGGLYHGE